jgi:hypothetical protein
MWSSWRRFSAGWRPRSRGRRRARVGWNGRTCGQSCARWGRPRDRRAACARPTGCPGERRVVPGRHDGLRFPVVVHLGGRGPIASRAGAASVPAGGSRAGARRRRLRAAGTRRQRAGLAATRSGRASPALAVSVGAAAFGSVFGALTGHGPPRPPGSQVRVLCQHPYHIAAIGVCAGGADVVAQSLLQAAGALDALLEHLHADAQVAHRVERRMGAAEGLVLVVVHARHHLHQPLGADRALRERVEAGLHRHDGQDQRRLEAARWPMCQASWTRRLIGSGATR